MNHVFLTIVCFPSPKHPSSPRVLYIYNNHLSLNFFQFFSYSTSCSFFWLFYPFYIFSLFLFLSLLVWFVFRLCGWVTRKVEEQAAVKKRKETKCSWLHRHSLCFLKVVSTSSVLYQKQVKFSKEKKHIISVLYRQKIVAHAAGRDWWLGKLLFCVFSVCFWRQAHFEIYIWIG